MAVAVLSKKKLKSRSSRRSPSSRTFEEEDEDAAIISLLEKEPWQPDLLLERRSDKITPDFKSHQNIAQPTMIPGLIGSSTSTVEESIDIFSKFVHNGDRNADTSTSQAATGSQSAMPAISTGATYIDYVDSPTSMIENVLPPAGIRDYSQQEHQEQLLLQKQQQEIQLQLPKEKDGEGGKEREEEKEKARENMKTGGKEEETGTLPMELHLQYQLPAHLRGTNANVHPNYRRQQMMNPPHLQQYRNSYHGSSLAASSSLGPFFGREEQTTASTSVHNLASRGDTPEEKVMVTDDEDVVESLQSLKNITMLALDGLLQQVVSDVTASDPIHNADETTLEARALIRRRSISLLNSTSNELEGLTMTSTSTSDEEHYEGISMRRSPTQRTISDAPIAGLATSSLERLDELTRKVDQLAAVAADEQQFLTQSQQQESNGMILSSSSLRKEDQILGEFLEAPVRHQETAPVQDQELRNLDSTQVFESEEYQLACALAAMLACIYRILNRMQQQQQQQQQYQEHQPFHVEERKRRTPQRTESMDSGLDQASKLWIRLSSNSFAKNSSRPLSPLPGSATAVASTSKTNTMRNHLPSPPEGKVLDVEQEPSSRTGRGRSRSGTNSFMQTINKQVRTLRSRRSQSTSHIEVGANRHGFKSLQGRLLGGFHIGSRNGKTTSSTVTNHSSLYPDTVQMEDTKELEKEWSELDKLMDEMAHLWRSVEQQQSDSEEETEPATKVDTDDDHENNPFHDRHQVQHLPQQQQQSTMSPMTVGVPYTMDSEQGKNFDQQTLEMSVEDDLPQYDDDIPDYRLYEKPTDSLLQSKNSRPTNGLINRTNHSLRRSNTNSKGRGVGGLVDDEKTRFDLNNVMSAIERLSRVAPRLDDQRVQLSFHQKKLMARASVAHTIQRLSRDCRDLQMGSSSGSVSAPASASFSPTTASSRKRESIEKRQDLDRLINQIVESANKASNSSFSTAQRAEFSPKQQWKLESARMGDRIERGSKLRMSDQDWESPEKVLLQDMTRLTNTLYQQSTSSKAFAAQRYTLTEDKARNMALQGIISKIERVSGRRLGNQDAVPPSIKSKPPSPSSICPKGRQSSSNDGSERVKELQEMLNQVMESGGGPTRKLAMASQRAEFGSKH